MPTRRRAPPLAPDERRAAIVDAVAPLLLERGAALTTKEIASAAGVAEGTLFAVFDDKRSLILHAIRRRLDPAPLREALAALDATEPPERTLRAAAEIALPLVDEVRTLAAALHALPRSPAHVVDGDRPGAGRQAVQAWNAALAQAIAELLAPHRDRLTRSTQRLGELFAAAVFGARPLVDPPYPPLAADELVDHFLHGALDPRAGRDR